MPPHRVAGPPEATAEVEAKVKAGAEPSRLDALLDRFFASTAPLGRGEPLLVALSGGPDSTALLIALAGWGRARGVPVWAGHLDHGQDPGSAERARHAARIAATLDLPCEIARRGAIGESRRRRGWEAAARRVRYAFLEELRQRVGARFTVTAHHRSDQAETVALRLLAGSGLAGLAAIRPIARQPVSGSDREPADALAHVVRPLLEVPAAELHRVLDRLPFAPSHDPGNDDLARPRNLLRRRLLPALERSDPELPRRLAELATAARGAAEAVDRALIALLKPRIAAGSSMDDTAAPLPAATVGLTDLSRLPLPLLPAALALLHRLAGARYPAPAGARAELLEQLADRLAAGGDEGGEVGCDAGGGWRWETRGERLWLIEGRRTLPAPFTYTLEVPGTVEIPDLSLRFRLRPARLEPWMLRGEARRAGLALPLVPGDVVTVRSRRPGDRLQPLGAPGRRRLKEVLIDRRVPRRERDRLPLLCLGRDAERIAWVPGVTVDEAFRLDARGGATAAAAAGKRVWLAALEPCQETEPT